MRLGRGIGELVLWRLENNVIFEVQPPIPSLTSFMKGGTKWMGMK
jgi:hypothetical protein